MAKNKGAARPTSVFQKQKQKGGGVQKGGVKKAPRQALPKGGLKGKLGNAMQRKGITMKQVVVKPAAAQVCAHSLSIDGRRARDASSLAFSPPSAAPLRRAAPPTIDFQPGCCVPCVCTCVWTRRGGILCCCNRQRRPVARARGRTLRPSPMRSTSSSMATRPSCAD